MSDMAESTVLIRFDRAPPARSRFSTAVFRYSVTEQDGSSGCKNNGCSIHCKVKDIFLLLCFKILVVLSAVQWKIYTPRACLVGWNMGLDYELRY